MIGPVQWAFYRSQYELTAAVEMVPEAVADPIVAAALVQIKVAHYALEARMQELVSAGQDTY